ncbi:PREDICTED: mitochondrial import receptor subunit TOM40 homolog 1-like [Ceratosolen solmsi marchali]|uniref:Mitochondrial import receptor subunit TOM40 homolog 1-like n=1 Tax=Ceratosolen solmsi marchali TaxID=326594 RepID=A0AAJ7DYI4_9HYME|nr:PREDICTED: mitochondrial import receptor subunit TOM40 homolog 1-like [Ceratosolen solmsi marchali]
MGSSCSSINNISTEFKDKPSGCVPCPEGNTPGNPGTFEDIHKKFENLNPKIFEGARILLKKNISEHFYVTHTFNMNSNMKSILLTNQFQKQYGYKFGAFYIGTKQVGNTEKYPVLYGDINPNGHLKATFIHTLGCRYRIKLCTNVKKSKFINSKASIEYRSDDFTLSVTLVDPIIFKQEGTLVLHFLQAITSRITLGVEIAYNAISSSNVGSKTNIAGAFRYSTGFRTISTTVGQAGVHICYHQKQSDQLQMGLEFQSNIIKKLTKFRLLYKLDIPQTNSIFKGFVDSEWKIGAVFEKKLYPIPKASLALSGILDHIEQTLHIGIGLIIEK